MQRKPGGYRKPTEEQRSASKIDKRDFNEWFRQIWTLTGVSTKNHPAPFPSELAYRLVRMFSFVGDVVLDPFNGSGTTMLAAMKCGRNSIGIEIDREYCTMAARKLQQQNSDMFCDARLEFRKQIRSSENGIFLQEERFECGDKEKLPRKSAPVGELHTAA